MAQMMPRGLVVFLFLLFVPFLTFTACQSDPTSIVVKDHGRDTIPITHTDTVVDTLIDTLILTVRDTSYVWCWEIDHNRDGHSAHYQCDNGYRGPLF